MVLIALIELYDLKDFSEDLVHFVSGLVSVELYCSNFFRGVPSDVFIWLIWTIFLLHMMHFLSLDKGA